MHHTSESHSTAVAFIAKEPTCKLETVCYIRTIQMVFRIEVLSMSNKCPQISAAHESKILVSATLK